jgi:nucleoside-triphosphatase THEP1
MIYYLTGEVNSGKTSLLSSWVEEYHRRNRRVCGILAPAVWVQGRKIAYNIVDVYSGETKLWASTEPIDDAEKWGRFWFSQEGLHFGQRALGRIDDLCDIGILDEAGPLELENRGWACSLREILIRPPKNMIIVVRASLVQPISNFFGIESCKVLTLDSPAPSLD